MLLCQAQIAFLSHLACHLEAGASLGSLVHCLDVPVGGSGPRIANGQGRPRICVQLAKACFRLVSKHWWADVKVRAPLGPPPVSLTAAFLTIC